MLSNTGIDQIKGYGSNTTVYDSVKRYSLHGLSELIRILMENMDDSLFDLSEKSETDRERNMYFEAMREIRLKRSALQQGFDIEMKQCFDLFSQNKPLNQVDEDPEELTLIELDDFEDSIAIDNMITKARPHFEDDLFAVEERLKVILHRKEINKDLNPLDPKAICDSFHNAAEVIESEIQIKLIFYKLFDKYVMSNLGHFYRELNEYFIDKGVLPDFKASQERQKKTSQFMANRIKSVPQAGMQSENSLNGDNPGEDPQVGAETDTSDGGMLSVLRQLISGSGPTPIAQMKGQPGNSDRWEPDGGFVETAIQPAIIPAAQNQGYMTALTGLQSSSINMVPVASVDPQVQKAQMQQQLIAFNQENSHQTSQSESQLIDIVSMLFDFFFDDEALPAPIKVLIGRLQIPILKVAIIDDSFFNQKKHPARKLLDAISKASIGWEENQQREIELVKKVEQIVENLLTDFEEDLSIFENALEDLDQFITSQEEKEKQAAAAVRQKEVEKEQEIVAAQAAAEKLVEKLIKKRELSFGVTDFLESIWTSVLFNIVLTMGESSNHWKNIRRISSTFIWTLIPKHTEEERLKILKTLPALLRAISKGMELIQVPLDEQNKIFQMMAKEHASIVKQTSKNIVTRVDDQTVWPEDKMAAAFAGFNESLANEEVDIEFVEDSTGEIQVIENDEDPDAITNITISETSDVIKNLEDFTEGVKQGDIQIEEEIVMGSVEQVEFHAQPDEQNDDFLEKAQTLEIGTWVEFIEEDGSSLNTKLSWKSNVTGKLVFVNRQGHKVKNMSSFGFATILRSGKGKVIESTSMFDRALHTIINTVKS